ncbi:CinA family nicotinamide mononucleotide deamidase-related protein [Chloroflexota bacterium]
MKAEIISIGTELLLGEITDTNAAYLAGQLPSLGIDLYWISQVGDNPARLTEVLKRAWQRSELILLTGGLGPTEDDITRETIAGMFGEKPEVVPALERTLRDRFSRMSMEMPISNIRQATIIPSAEPVSNVQGTAPGWWVERDGRILVAMPGPPRELHAIWEKEVRPRLQRSSASIILPKTFKTYGLSEAAVGEMISSLLSSANPTLGIYAKVDGIHLRLAAKSKDREQAEKLLVDSEAAIRDALGDHIWGVDDETLESTVGNLLIEKGLSLAVMEDCTGGWLAAAFAAVPGSDSFFRGGLVACSDEVKAAFGVNPGIISRYGVASPEVAEEMADAVKTSLRADIGICTTAIEETEERPSGIAYIGIANGGRISREVGRPQWKDRIISAALFELRRLLLSLD